MFRKRKQIMGLVMLFLLILTGCSSTSGGTTAIKLSKEGIVTKSVFKNLKDQGSMGVFNGTDDSNGYQWTFMGTDIEKPRDLNLKIDFSEYKVNEIKKQLNATVAKGFSYAENTTLTENPTLSITLEDENWQGNQVALYHYDGKEKTATLVDRLEAAGKSKKVVSFDVKDRKGVFYLVNIGPSGEGAAEKDLAEQDAQKNLDLSQVTGEKGNTDQYGTQPVPPGKPNPVEPENQKIDKGIAKKATLYIECTTVLNNWDQLDPNKKKIIPSNGIVLKKKEIEFYQGETVFDVLKRETRNAKIHMEFNFTPAYNSAYIEGINNLYEFDCGSLSGWMYEVNGWFPNYGSSRYVLKEGDQINWRYTCDLGRDIGGGI